MATADEVYESLASILMDGVHHIADLFLAPDIHEPISTECGDLRLCAFLQPESSKELSLVLIKASLNDQPVYTALSYAWGDPQGQIPIRVNGKEFLVNRNLHAALCRLRNDPPRLFWIDAICINQKDVTERNAQVPRMAHIYANAERVVSWLGDEVEPDLSLAKRLLLQHVLSEYDGVHRLREHIDTGEDGENRTERADYVLLQALQICFGEAVDGQPRRTDYWSRAWVTQEVAAARHLILHAGAVEVPFSWIVAFNRYPRWLERADMDELGPTRHHLVTEYSRPRIWPDYPADTLLKTLAIHRSTMSTDPRDKVYAFLGIATDGIAIAPDYSHSVCQVYTEVAEAIMSSTSSLNVLCYRALDDANPLHDLPSWVPDWSAEKNQFLVAAGDRDAEEPMYPFSAGGTAADYQIFNAGSFRVLTANGFRLGVVGGVVRLEARDRKFVKDGSLGLDLLESLSDSLAELMAQLPRAANIMLANILETIIQGVKLALPHVVFPSLLIQLNALAKVSQEPSVLERDCAVQARDYLISKIALAHVLSNLEQAKALLAVTNIYSAGAVSPEGVDGLLAEKQTPPAAAVATLPADEVLQKWAELYGVPDDVRALWSNVLRRSTQRQRGNAVLGVGPDCVQTDDIVVVLFGCDCPLVLRPKRGAEGMFDLVGSVYIQGINEGGALEKFKQGMYTGERFNLA